MTTESFQPQVSLGSLADGMTAGLILVDAENRYVYANAAAEGFLRLGRAEMLGRPVTGVTHAMRMPLLLAIDVLKHGSRPVVTGRFPLNGLTVSAEFSRTRSAAGTYQGVAVLIRDTTESDGFCSQLLRVERMAVLGELAAAIAHEINSPLGGVMESVRIIRKNAGNWAKVERFLPLVERGLEQIEATVRQMLNFTTLHEESRTDVVLEDVVRQCVDLLRCRQGETGAELVLDLATERTVVVADDHALSQLLINLINNALDAVAGRPVAQVTVATRILPSSGEVAVQVRDNGPGVPVNLRARIFDPFFTTKPSGKGTGLGLSIAARIAARHGGRIIVSEAEGGGSVFSLVLPLVGQPAEEDNEGAGQ
jgi:signal transduction histidine kinase